MATNIYLTPGVGYIVSRASIRTSNAMIIVAGDVVLDTGVTNTLVEGLNLVSYPYNCDVNAYES